MTNVNLTFLTIRPEFTLQAGKLSKDRILSSCGLIRGKDGFPLVAIIGGNKKGMEVFNPRASKTELLWDEIPPEKGFDIGLRWANMIPINKGSEFLLYGGQHKFVVKDIWKYFVSNNTWQRYKFNF